MPRKSILLAVVGTTILASWHASTALRQEHFDQPPPNWEGINNHNTHFPLRKVTQDFGFNPTARHFEQNKGEIGGVITPAGEAAYYGYRLPKPLTLDDSLTASGQMRLVSGKGHCLLGFFNTNTLNEWRTPNTLVARLNTRGETFHCHFEYTTSKWRAGAGVIGEIEPGKRITATELPCGDVFRWSLVYEPGGNDGQGLITFTLGERKATCRIERQHRSDGATFTHFGLLPVLKAWDDPGELWIADITINGQSFNFATDPKWDQFNNRRTYETKNSRPRFDFGWSPTHHAGGKAAGELGGLIFRGDCREPARMGAYGDKLSLVSLNSKLFARGRIAMVRGVTDSTASIGFYHSHSSLGPSPAQDQAIPMDYLGINIEGPSSEGFFFYPVYRVHGALAQAFDCRSETALRIYPDGRQHNWVLEYDPAGADGAGKITLCLDDKTCALNLAAEAKAIGASFDRFGICTPWIDGNSVTAYFDDLEYTCTPVEPAK